MRRSGPISLVISLAIHGALIGAAILSIRATSWAPPKIHLVYGEHGGEDSRASIVVSSADAPPAADLSVAPTGKISTEGLDARIFGESFDSAIGVGPNMDAPSLMTASGGDAALFASNVEDVPKFSFKAPMIEGGASSGRSGTASGTDVASIPQPIYPKESLKLKEQGTVLLEVEIKPDGSIGEIKILQHPGHERLVNAAIDAIKKARIEPAVEDGRPIASTVRVPFNFVLR